MVTFENDYRKLAEKIKETLFDRDFSPITCSLHDILADDESHNCLACNMADYTWGVYQTVQAYALLGEQASADEYILDQHVVFSIFNWLHVMVEALLEIEKILNISLIVRADEFRTCTRIIKWTNFFKHPKAMIFVHHPNYVFSKAPEGTEIVIDEEFVFKFYTNKNTNDELKRLLANKPGEKVFVELPDLFKLIEEFSVEINEMIELINCGPYKRLLSKKSTIQNYYVETD